MSDIHRYSQGICQDGAAILSDGVQMTVDEIVSTLNDHLKAIEAKDEYISHHNIVLDGQSEMIAKRDKTIEAQAKEIAELKKEMEMLKRTIDDLESDNEYLNKDKERRINQDWDNYQPSPRNMG